MVEQRANKNVDYLGRFSLGGGKAIFVEYKSSLGVHAHNYHVLELCMNYNIYIT